MRFEMGSRSAVFPAGEVLSGGGGVPTENESCNKVIESRRETVAGWFQGRRKWKEKSCFIVVQFELTDFRSSMFLCCLSLHALNSSVRLVTSLRGADFWSCVSSAESR